MTGGIIFPVEIPHGVAPILQRLHPLRNAYGHDLNHGQSGMSQQPYPAHQVQDVPVSFPLRVPWAPTQALLQRGIIELGEANLYRVRQGDVIYIKPLRGPVFGCPLWGTG